MSGIARLCAMVGSMDLDCSEEMCERHNDFGYEAMNARLFQSINILAKGPSIRSQLLSKSHTAAPVRPCRPCSLFKHISISVESPCPRRCQQSRCALRHTTRIAELLVEAPRALTVPE